MAEIDPVILELRAELGRYRADLAATATMAERNFARQDRAVRNLEKQMMRSSTAISGALRGLAGTLATAFTGRELVNLLDGYTRLQNALRVAGLEGEDLASVQSSLMDLSAKYGVSINGLADLYGKTAQSASDLGASQSQLLQLTEASAQALRITGTSATAAQGALLGLTQALASGIVRAEEFNQINEGGLRPLLQVAANTERFGGSVARLRAAVADGKVTSQEFYASILAGSAQLEGQASKATLTLAGAFEALHSQLIVYFGEAGAGSGATQALSDAIKALADNLDTIIPLLAIVATTIGVRYVTAMLTAAGSTGVASTALFALQARAAGAATSMEALALASATAGRSLLAAFGGPVGVAILAFGASVYLAAERTRYANEQSSELAATFRVLLGPANIVSETLDDITGGFDRMVARVDGAIQTYTGLSGVLSRVVSFLGEVADAAYRTLYPLGAAADYIGELFGAGPARGRKEGRGNKETPSRPGAPAVSGRAGGRGGRAGRSGGPSAADRENAFQSELRSAQMAELQARAQLATDVNERADLERELLTLEREQQIASITQDRDLSASQRQALLDLVDSIYGHATAQNEAGDLLVSGNRSLRAQIIERERQRELEREAADLADAQYRIESEELQGRYDLAESTAERRRVAMEILDLEFRHREAILQSVIASETASEADKQIARLTLDRLSAIRANATEAARRGTEGPGEAYLRSLTRDAEQLNDAYNQVAVDGLKALSDGLTDAILGSKSLGDVFKNVADQIIADLIRIAIQQAIVQPLANSLFGGGGDGGIGNFVGSLFGRASGGFVAPGQTVRINEASSRGQPEFFRPTGSGTIIPLGQVNAAPAQAAAAGGIATVRVILSDDLDGRIAQVSGNVAVEVVRTTAPAIIDAGANEAIRRAGRPTL